MLTAEEIKALQSAGLSDDTPYMMTGVSSSQMSVARHYNGCRYQGAEYIYDPVHDTLIRADVLKWVAARRRVEKKKAAWKAAEKQGKLF